MIICPNMSNPDVAREFNEIKDAIEAVNPGKGEIAAYQIWSLNNGNGIDKAPNGAQSTLFQSLLDYYEGDRAKAIVAKAKTYSKPFLKWFGDWTNHGNNPYSSEITIGNASPDYDSADMNGAGAMFAIRKNGEYIGSIAINAYYRKGDNIEPWGEKGTNRVSMSSVGDAVEIEKEFRGKGYGKAAYFEFAKRIANMGYVLTSAPLKSRTEASTRVWESLVRDGYAKKIGDRYEFINSALNSVSKVVDENGEPLVVWHGSRISDSIEEFKNDNTFFADRYAAFSYTPFNVDDERGYMYPVFLSIKNPKLVDASGNFWNDINGESTDDIARTLYENDGAIISNLKDYSDFTPVNPELSISILEEAPLHTDYITSSKDQIKSVDNRDGEYTGNNIYHNLSYTDMRSQAQQEMLDRGLIERYDKYSFQLTTDDISFIREICDKYGLVYNTYTLKSGRVKISFSTKEAASKKKDKIFKSPSRQEILQENFSAEQLSKEDAVVSEVVAFLKDKFPQLNILFISRSELSEMFNTVNPNANSFVIGNTVYLIKERVNSEIAIEEILHPLVYTIANQNWGLFQQFLEEAKQDFPKLVAEIETRYNSKLGFDDQTRQLELVTQVLSRYVNKKYRAGEKGSKLQKLIEQFFDYIGSLFTSFVGKFTGKDHDFDSIKTMKLSELADIVLAQDSKFHVYTTEQIQYSISSRQQAAQDESQRLIIRMNVLYREYEKLKDKTPSQQRIADRIFETLNKLKRHRDISAVGIALEQAKLSLGQYDPATAGPSTASSSNVYSYLYNAKQNNFDGVEAKALVDMYRNTIKFYSDLISGIPSEQVIDLSQDDIQNIENIKSLIDNHIMPLWIEAIMKVGDDIVDQQIDEEVEASDENKEDMKKVAKDWLHKNMMYGDITAFTSYLYNYSYSSNPIIKQAFHLIQHAEQQTLEEMHQIAPGLMKAYQLANKGARSFTPGWQSIMMEFDDEGKPTGNFIRDLNYGLYQKDLKNFIDKLNEDFLNKYQFTYVTDDTGAIVNSLTGEFAEDEEWGPNGEMPKYVEYQLEIEKFKADRVHRRFRPHYYMERLTRPYDGTIDPMSPEFIGTKFNHGLSPKTLARYSYYNNNINYYLSKCQDPKTGLVYPEKLSDEDKRQLDQWTSKLEKFTNPFNEDGSYKMGEDLKMAYEVRAWQKYIGQFNDSKHLQDQFNAELTEAYQKSISENNPRIYQDFLRFNASVGINPDFIEQTVGSMKSMRSDTDLSLRGKLMRAALQDQVKMQLSYQRDLGSKKNNPLFWLRCKQSDQAIEDSKDPNNKSGWDKDKVKQFKDNFYDREILYIDPITRMYIDENGNQVNPNSPDAKMLEDAGKLLTFRQYLINEYTNEALQNGYVEGLIDESTGLPLDFSGLTAQEIRRHIVSLLSYRRRSFEEDGSVTETIEPLSIFTMLTPKQDTFVNRRTGKTERTIVYLGERRFKDSSSMFLDAAYEPNKGVSEIPNAVFDNGRYDNSEAYDNMRSDKTVADLYDKLIQTMQDSQNVYSTNRVFNYRLPQINAHTAAMFSRIIKRGYSQKAISGIWNSMFFMEANDDNARTKEDYFVGTDGEMANDVPLKFIRRLKNPEDISTDLVSSVILFADMALNYKNKSGIDATLKLLRYNMDPENRNIYNKKLKPKSEPVSESEANKNSRAMFDSMMDVLMYGNKFGDPKTGGPGKTTVAIQKTADAFQSLESSAMLGLNMFSMSVGFADSITRILSESVAGKYMTTGDCLWALGKCLWYTPLCIKNMFNPLANNKLTALMQMNGISKGTYGTYVKADWDKGRKFLSNFLMGGWSMLDWMANALLMTAFYHNVRFYEGLKDDAGNSIIEAGFYSKYDLQQAFLKAGRTKHEANLVHANYAGMFSSTEEEYMKADGSIGKRKVLGRISLWDAYEFAPYTKIDGKVVKLHGQVRIKEGYEQYVTQKLKTRIATKTKKRGGLYNGMNPDNDVPRWKRDVIGRLAGALRGWIVQQLQHLISGGTDNIAREFETKLEYETTSSGTRAVTRRKKKKLTDEQRSRRFAWDYETGTTQDQVLIGLYRSVSTIFRMSKQLLLSQPKTAKLSEVEKYAWKDTIIFVAMLAMMMVGWTYIHDDARTVQPPKSREEAGPASMFNPVDYRTYIDYYTYIRDVYIPNQYWKLAVDDIYFRTVEAKISNVNPQQVLDIVSALTALKSGLDDQLGVFGIASDLINGEDNNEVLKQGAYKFYTKGERTLYRAIGPEKNLHTALTYYGATNNLRWYTNKFGVVYRAFGYDFKKKDKEAESYKRSGRSGRSGSSSSSSSSKRKGRG